MAIFETERLIARRLTTSDVPAMMAVYADPETVRYVGDGTPITQEECFTWVEVTDRNFERRGYGMVAFVERASGEVVGFGGIVHPDQQPEPEAKYAFRRDLWGKGLASEILVALVRHATEKWGVGEMIATVYPENLPSQRVLTKAGFVFDEDRPNDDGTITRVFRRPCSGAFSTP